MAKNTKQTKKSPKPATKPATKAPAKAAPPVPADQRGKGTRAKTFKTAAGTEYDLSHKGFGMLAVVLTEERADLKKPEVPEGALKRIAALLARRDQDCGKPPASDYAHKAKVYARHARKHLADECSCGEIDPALLSKPPVVR